MTKYRNELARFLMGTIFLVYNIITCMRKLILQLIFVFVKVVSKLFSKRAKLKKTLTLLW